MGFPYFLSNDYPVFVLQDDEDNICYWVSPLKTTSYTTDELVFEPYLNYLKKHYINVKYFDKTGKKYQINELYADPDSHAICVRFATSSKMRLETLKSRIASKELMLLDDYKTYAAEQERLRQIAEEKARIRQQEALRKKQQETLRKQEEERQKVLAEQRKKQIIIQKYGQKWGTSILNGKVELGMTKQMCREVINIKSYDIGKSSHRGHVIETWTFNKAKHDLQIAMSPRSGEEAAALLFLAGLAGAFGVEMSAPQYSILVFTDGKLTSLY